MTDSHIRKQGFLKRLKTQKKRYFVLHSVSPLGNARFEYYESEKKFRSKAPPKRVIQLARCLNIARKGDTKQKFAFALYTREDVFGLICDTEDDLKSWLDALMDEKKKSEVIPDNDNDYIENGEIPPSFPSSQAGTTCIQHVSIWHVTVKSRGLGTSRNLAGACLLKLTNQVLTLVSRTSDDVIVQLQLANIRRCGHTDCFFFMEVGRLAVTGAGELWLQVDDPILAQHMHEAILGAMQTFSSDNSSPNKSRTHPRPQSVVLTPPIRSRSDTMPDSPILPRRQMGTSSLSKPVKESDSPKSKSAMFSWLLPGGKKRQDDPSSRPKGRRTQSKSLSVEPVHGGLLSRAQSVDFTTLLSGLEIPSSPDSPKDIEASMSFEVVEPVRTMSNSSGSSGYSSGRSWDTQVKVASGCTTEADTRKADNVKVTSSRPSDVTEEETYYVPMDSGNDDTLKREKEDAKQDVDHAETATKEVGNEDDHMPITQRDHSGYEDDHMPITQRDHSGYEDDHMPITQRDHSGYEDMSSHVETLTREREQSEPDHKKQSADPQFMQQVKSSPKQTRTSEATSNKTEILEVVNIKSSPKSIMKKKGHDLAGSPGSPRRRRQDATSSPNLARRKHDEYIQMNPIGSFHTYVNFTPGGSFDEEDEDPSYMNFTPRQSTDGSTSTTEQHSYINFKPGAVFSERVAEESRSVAKESPSMAKESPGVVGESPSVAEESPSVAKESPNVAEESPNVAEESPVGVQEAANFAKDSPSVAKEFPNVAEESPVGAQEAANGAKESPSLAKEAASVADETPSVTKESPSVAKEAASVADETPSVTKESPSIAKEAASVTKESPSVANEDASVAREGPNYMNFRPGDVKGSTSPKSNSSKKKPLHTYENVDLNGAFKETGAPGSHDYMNVCPRRFSNDLAKGKSSPSRRSTGGILSPRGGSPRRMVRRESEPVKGLSDEDTGMLFLDFSKNQKTKEEKELNYISLDLGRREGQSPKGSPQSRPNHIDLRKCRNRLSDLGPKSAPPRADYSEIDFTKSQGLRQARLEKENPKT